MIFNFGNTDWQLLPEKALYQEKLNLLVLGDIHIGKTTEFRNAGIALPRELQEKNILKLIQLIRNLDVRKVVFLGDLFHGKENQEFEYVSALCLYFSSVEFVLVMGNHEKMKAEFYEKLGLTVVTKLKIEEVTLVHEPDFESEEMHISGHLHPGIRIQGKGRDSLVVPVFAARACCFILPAFGNFTGKYLLNVSEWQHLFVVGEKRVLKLK